MLLLIFIFIIIILLLLLLLIIIIIIVTVIAIAISIAITYSFLSRFEQFDSTIGLPFPDKMGNCRCGSGWWFRGLMCNKQMPKFGSLEYS